MKKILFKANLVNVATFGKLVKKSELSDLLASMGEDFEESNFEEQHNFGGGMNADTKVKLMEAGLKSLKEKNRGVVNRVGQSDPSEIYGLIQSSVGDLNLTVTRASAAINAPLPFILFGANDSQAGYASTLNGLLSQVPAGTTVAVTTSATGDILFTWTNGMNVDIITITNLGNINYKSFLASMQNNYFATKFFLISISDETYNLVQFSQPLFFGVLSALGATNANQLVFRSRIFSWMFRKDRIEVVLPEQSIVPDFSFAMSIVAVAGLSIGFDFYMSKRLNLNKA